MIGRLRRKCCCGSTDLGCATSFECGGFPVPRFLSIDWGTVTAVPAETCPACCEVIPKITLLSPTTVACNQGSFSVIPCGYVGQYQLLSCPENHVTVIAQCTDSDPEPWMPTGDGPGLQPAIEATISTDGTTIAMSVGAFCYGESGIEDTAVGYSGSGPDDGSPITLTKTTGSDNCNWSGSITVTPLTGIAAKALAGCLCSPLLVPSTDDGLLRLNFSIGGGTGSACLGGSRDPETLLWSWTGTGTVELGTCDGQTLQFDIFLDESAIDLEAESQECPWVLRITDASNNVEELPIEVTTGAPVNVDASGTLTTICGGGAFAGTAQEFTGLEDDRHPYMRCCTPTIAEQCSLPQTIQAAGEVVPSAGSTCSTTIEQWAITTGDILCSGSPITLTGFDSSDEYFFGDFPIDDGFGTGNYKVVLYCDGTSMRYAVLSGGCELESGGVTSWNCATKSGYIDTTIPLDGCTPGGATARINLG